MKIKSIYIYLSCSILMLALTPSLAFSQIVKRINCGGGDIVLDDGRVFSADHAYPGPDGAGHIGGTSEGDWFWSGNLCEFRALQWWGGWPFDQVLEGALFYSGRRDPQEYRFDLPDGDYVVQIHLSETESHGPGQSAFDLVIEGYSVIDGLDVYSEAGRYVALKVGSHARVTDGQLNVELIPALGTPQINAIEVFEHEPDSSPPGALVDLFGVESYGVNGLYWDPSLEEDIAGYNVYRYDPNVISFEQLNADPVLVSFYLDYDVVPSSSYIYSVAAVDVFGNEGPQSYDVILSPHEITESILDIYHLTLDNNLLAALDADPYSDDYYPAVFEFEDQLFYDAEIRYRGSSASGRQASKKSWKVKFQPDNRFDGLRRLNLKSQFGSFLKIEEKICFDLFELLRTPSPHAEPVLLEVNGKFRGEFLDIENVDKVFLERRGLDQNGNLYKIVFSDLSLPPDPGAYDSQFEKKTNRGTDHSDLQAFLEAINLTPQEDLAETLASVLNIPEYLDFYSIQIITANWEFIANNYYLYQNPSDGRWTVIPWDLDFTLFDPLPIDYGTEAQPDFLFGQVNKLVDRFLSVPQFRFAYCQNLRRLLNTIATGDQIAYMAQTYFDRISEDVRRDLMKGLGGWNDIFEVGPDLLSEMHEGRRTELLWQLYDYMPELEGVLYINEFMADNVTVIPDGHGEYEDWIEIYNGGYVPIDLGGMFLTDDPADTHKWVLPEVTLGPGEFLLIWADDDEEQGLFHANFKLGASGEYIGLYDLEENGHALIDAVSFGEQSPDISMSRDRDGSWEFVFDTEPSPGESNDPPPLEPLTITDVIHSPRLPRAGEPAVVTAAVIDDMGPAEYVSLYYDCGTGYVEAMMYDDGLHGDGMPWDNIFGAVLPGFSNETVVRYYIRAGDMDGQISHDPEGAPSVTHAYAVGLPRIYVNEFMADNDHVIPDEAGEYDDWFELYNDEEEPVFLGGMYLSDRLGNPLKWPLPAVSIPAKGHLLLWADEDQEQGEFHTNFKLSKSGEAVWLFSTAAFENVPIDVVLFEEQYMDVSYGRYPDGAADLRFFDVSTPGGPNGDLFDPGAVVDAIAEDIADLVEILTSIPTLMGYQGMVNKLYEIELLLIEKVEAFEEGLISTEAYLEALDEALAILRAFDNQLEAKASKGKPQIPEAEADELRRLSGEVRQKIETLREAASSGT